jgi:energy-coupling factor transport system substrate-specific component
MEPRPASPLPQVPRSGFTTMTLVLIPMAIGLNIAVGQLITLLKLPIYLDSIGTVLVGALAGPIAGLFTGALTNIVWGLTLSPPALPFFYVAAVIGVLAGFAGDMGLFVRRSPTWLSVLIGGVFVFTLTYFVLAVLNMTTSPDGFPVFPAPGELMERYQWVRWVYIVAALIGAVLGAAVLKGAGYAGLAGLFTGLVAAIISAPTAAIVFGGVTGAGTDLLVAAFRASGAGILASTFAQGVVSDPFDKLTTFLLVWIIVRALPMRLKAR